MRRKIVAAASAAAWFVVSAAAFGSGLAKPIYTIPGELDDMLLPDGPHHPQGATCSEEAIYISCSQGIVKLDWQGRVVKTCRARWHLGDIAYADGRIYGVFGLHERVEGETPLMVGVWDSDLNFVTNRFYNYPNARGFDSAVVLGDTLYTSIDHYWDGKGRFHHPPHRDNTVMMISTRDLSVKGIKDVVFDYPIHFSTQNLSTDGENLLFVNYGANKDEGNDPWLNYTRTTPSLETIGGPGQFFGQWGFARVPKSRAKRDTPVFFTVNAPEHGQWGCGPGKKRPQLRLDFFAYDRNTGAMRDITDRSWKPVGFWRVSRDGDGRWWAVSPNGSKTLLRGVDHVSWGGMWCEALGTSPYREEMERHFASRADWEEQTLGRLKEWGFNALGSGCSPELRGHGLAHCEFLGMGEAFAAKGGDRALGAAEGIPGTAFPNVFHRDFAAFCDDRAAQMCAPQKDDTSLFGYFFDNELAWYGRGDPATGLYDAAANAPDGDPAHEALRAFLAKRGATTVGRAVPDEVKTEFLRLAARRYFETIAAAIRRHDPNHLLLGCRFAGLNSAHRVVWEEAGKTCDVVTFNQYPWADLDENAVYLWRDSRVKVADAFAERHAWVKKPMLVSEWSFIALDSGLPCTGGYGQRFRTQGERVQAAELFSKTLFAMPFMIGGDFFMWVDEPALGISKKFPENSNYGLVDGCGKPYGGLTAMFARINREAEALHAKGAPPAAKTIDRAAKEKAPLFQSVRTGAPNASASFAREGDRYSLTTSEGLCLKGRVGGQMAFESVRVDGLDCGSFTFMVYHGDWQDIERVESAEWMSQSGALRIAGTGKSGCKSFRVVCDIVPFTGTPWFACNVVSVENTGAEDFADASVWLRQYSSWAKDAALPEAPKPVPDMWNAPASGVWIRAADGAWCGAATYAETVKQFIYYVSADGAPHPDAAFSKHGSTAPMRLAAGARWQPGGQVWMVAAAGRGGLDGWHAFLDDFSAASQCVKKGENP